MFALLSHLVLALAVNWGAVAPDVVDDGPWLDVPAIVAPAPPAADAVEGPAATPPAAVGVHVPAPAAPLEPAPAAPPPAYTPQLPEEVIGRQFDTPDGLSCVVTTAALDAVCH